MRRIALFTAVLVAASLAGCTEGSGGPTTTKAPKPWSVDVYSIPSSAVAGEPFDFELDVDGPAHLNSPHIGGHFWNASAAPVDPDRDFDAQAGSCQHQPGSLPGVFTVSCTIQEAGDYLVFGHAQVRVSGEVRDLWDGPHAVTVAATA